jgi:outer membrane protein assembly factor BamD (BamD/ComL family)
MIPARTGRILLLVAAAAALVALASCKSTGPVDLTGLTPAEVFQRAQDASDNGDYGRALAYYEGFLADPAVDPERGAWARYETALLYHKLGDDDTALAKFDELLALYETNPKLPEGPKVLAANAKAAILEKREKKTSTTP